MNFAEKPDKYFFGYFMLFNNSTGYDTLYLHINCNPRYATFVLNIFQKKQFKSNPESEIFPLKPSQLKDRTSYHPFNFHQL